MKNEHKPVSPPNYRRVNRRNFLKSLGLTGLSSVVGSKVLADSNEPNVPAKTDPNAPDPNQPAQTPQVPKRKFGKSDELVSALALGALQLNDQVILTSLLKWGVTYWDTANMYGGGNSEMTIGKYLAANPDMRKNVFIVTKASGARNIQDVEERLQTSLKRMNTGYVDVFYGVHVLNDISQLTDELKTWSQDAKKRGLIKHFGFSTHKNMQRNLLEASKLDWIDAILTTYNYRLTKDPVMQKAVDACYRAGIALTAMKTQGLKVESDDDKKLVEHFLSKGFTEGQARLKAVLEDERIVSAAVGMNSVSLINQNVAAVLDKTTLSRDDKTVLDQYAKATCTGYCAGCAEICDAAVPEAPYISDVMRCLMYHNSYGDTGLAKSAFAEIPAGARNKLAFLDYSAAEARCPQHIPIARLVKKALDTLA